MMRLPINIKQDKSTCQGLKLNSTSDKQLQDGTVFKMGQEVYLYGDRNYTGTLIRAVEGTYPLKWTVELDRGGYEAVNVGHISLAESQPSNLPKSDLDLPFGDAPESNYAQLQRENAQLQREIILLFE